MKARWTFTGPSAHVRTPKLPETLLNAFPSLPDEVTVVDDTSRATMKGRHQFKRRFSLQPSFMKDDSDDEKPPRCHNRWVHLMGNLSREIGPDFPGAGKWRGKCPSFARGHVPLNQKKLISTDFGANRSLLFSGKSGRGKSLHLLRHSWNSASNFKGSSGSIPTLAQLELYTCIINSLYIAFIM